MKIIENMERMKLLSITTIEKIQPLKKYQKVKLVIIIFIFTNVQMEFFGRKSCNIDMLTCIATQVSLLYVRGDANWELLVIVRAEESSEVQFVIK
jgi:hypothetical protein